MSIIVARRREVPQWKREEVSRLKNWILKYNVIGVAEIAGIGSYQLYEIRHKLKGKVLFRVSKNTLVKKAIMEIKDKKAGIEKLVEYLKGQNIFIFTNMNPFELYLFLEKNKVPRPARAGDIAPEDIVIPAGNTGFPPGPIISKFNQYNVPIRIEEGSIVIVKDTIVVRKGEVIPEDLADLLNRLDLRPIKVGIKLKAVYCMGRILSGDELKIVPDEYRMQLVQAHDEALKLAISIAYPSKELMEPIIINAYLKALNLALAIQAPIPEAIHHIIACAITEANTLASIIAPKCPELGLRVREEKLKAPKEEAIKEEVKEEKKEEEEEEILSGLAGLFG